MDKIKATAVGREQATGMLSRVIADAVAEGATPTDLEVN